MQIKQGYTVVFSALYSDFPYIGILAKQAEVYICSLSDRKRSQLNELVSGLCAGVTLISYTKII
jgi:hypothetical protein